MTSPYVDDDRAAPDEVADRLWGLALAAGPANVVMQLSRLPIGHGVARSTVHSGRADLHPLKRLRTTTAYLMIAVAGTREERLALRAEIDAVHARVHSAPEDPVAYDAFDPELQLWVAACLYVGFEQMAELLDGGPLDPELVEQVLYPHGRRFATTLQVPAKLWPADREAFETYWSDGVQQIRMDDLTRTYLTELVENRWLADRTGVAAAALRPVLASIGRFVTLGFLPAPFRSELGLPYGDRQAAWHRRVFRLSGSMARLMPRSVRSFPLNLYLWDARRRMRTGRPVV